MLRKSLILFVVFLQSLEIFAQVPSNDTVDGAIELIVGNSPVFNVITGTTVDATDSENDSSNPVPAPDCPSEYKGGDVWYKATVPSSGEIHIKMTSELIDYTTFYSGTPNNLTFIDCIRQPNEMALTDRTPGETIYMRLWEIGNDQFGEFEIVAYDYFPPANDNLNNAKHVTVGTNFDYNITTGNLINATTSDNDNSTDVRRPACLSYSIGYISDVWYTTTIPESGIIIIKLTGSNQEGYEVFLDKPNINSTPFRCYYQGHTTSLGVLPPGKTIYIRVFDTQNNSNSIFNLITYDPSPVNQDIDNAYQLTVGTSPNENNVSGSNYLASASGIDIPNDCSFYEEEDVDLWFKVTMPTSGNLVISESTIGNLDRKMEKITLFSGTSNNPSLIDCHSTKSGDYFLKRIDLAGKTVYLRLSSQPDKRIYYNIVAYEPSNVATNDYIENAIELTIGNNPSENIVSGTNTYATSSFMDISDYTIPPDCYSTNDTLVDIWFKTSIPNSGNLTILETNTHYMSVYKAPLDNLSIIDCHLTENGEFKFLNSEFAGETIYIRLQHNKFNTEQVYSIVAFEPTPPINDDIENAIELTTGSNLYDSVVNGTLQNATIQNDLYTFSSTNPDVWYKITIPDSGELIINSEEKETELFIGNPNNLILLTQSDYTIKDDKIRLKNNPMRESLAGEALYVRKYASSISNIDNSEFAISAFEPTIPDNDFIYHAIELTVGANTFENIVEVNMDNSTESTNDLDYPIPESRCFLFNETYYERLHPDGWISTDYYKNYDSDVWYKVKIPENGWLDITAYVYASYEREFLIRYYEYTRISILSGSFDDLVIEDMCFNPTSSINRIYGEPGKTIYLRIWGNDVKYFSVWNSEADLSTSNLNLKPLDYSIENNIFVLDTLETVDSIAIYSITGQLLTVPINQTNTKADMSGLNSGIYLINITIGKSSQIIKVAI